MGAIAIRTERADSIRSEGAKPLGSLLGPRGAPGLFADLERVPAALLARLPIPPRMGLHAAGVPGVIRVDPFGDELDGADAVVFDADEWLALVVATEADRVWPADFRGFCARKRAEPGWRLELAEALAGGQPDRAERWDLGRVLRRLDLRLLSAEL